MRNLMKLSFIATILVTFVSCGGQKPMVKEIKVRPYYENSDVHVSLESTMQLGNVSLPAISLPIILPKSGETIGSVAMQTVLGGNNLIAIDVNLSKVVQVQSSHATLPNGNLIPLIGNNEVIVIPIQNKVNLYLTVGNSVAALGVDIPFSTLDALGSRVGNVSLFPIFNINQIIGSAGMYFSKESGKNGFGLFADISNVLDDVMFIDLGQAKSDSIELQSEVWSKSAFRSALPRSSRKIHLSYNSYNPSKSAKRKIDKELYKLHKRRARLRLR